MENLVFTRYLYPKLDVKQSLLIALLDRNSNNALFWAYELYYSGFEEDLFEYIYNIYDSFYKLENPELEHIIQEKWIEWNENKNDCIVGSIIITLTVRNYQICDFVKDYIGNTVFPMIHKTSCKFIVKFNEADLSQYKTVRPEKEKTRQYLASVCKYPINRAYNDFFGTSCSDYNEEFYNWEYYAVRCPLWLYRIQRYGGRINHETKKIDFPDDDAYEAFYDDWGLEPDEQSVEVQEKCIGNCERKQLSTDDFCEKYGGAKSEPITNSIIFTS